MSSDPVVAAASRVLKKAEQAIHDGGSVNMTPRAMAQAGAREALTPLRQLEVPRNIRVVAEMLAQLKMDTPKDQKTTDDFVAMIRNMADNVARCIYPSEG